MGAMQALDLATNLDLSLENALSLHLSANHYPPIPQSMIPVCVEAIDAYWEDDTNRLIQLPIDGVDRNGEPFQIRWRDGSDKAPAWAIIEHAHLDSWLVDDYEDEEE
jgi:hypothetical protein